MDKSELKKVLKPLIKECIKEVLMEHGVSSLVTEARPSVVQLNTAPEQNRNKMVRENLEKKKKKMLDAIGKDAYNGVNLFEGTTPAPTSNEPTHGPLSGTAPGDPGVDITKLPNFNVWKKLAGT